MKMVLRHVMVQGRECRLQVRERDGQLPLILYLHGLGCDSSDAEMMLAQPALAGFAVCAPDLPGHGGSMMPAGMRLTLADGVEVAHQLAGERDVMLVGHSMGGAIGLLYAERYPVKYCINIEGNLAPENCHFSRESKRRTAAAFEHEAIPEYLAKLRASKQPAIRHYADTLTMADPRAVYGMADALVDLCDSNTLIDRFLGLGVPRIYLYGDRNRDLTYLPALRTTGLRVVEIPQSGHFPHLDNPPAVAAVIAEFLSR